MFKHLLYLTFLLAFAGAVVAQTDKSATTYYNDGVSLKNNKKYSEALEMFKKAIAKKPDYTDALYYAGWVSIELKKYNDALLYLEKARKLAPEDDGIYLEIGYANDKLNNLSEAEDNYKKSISLKKENPLAYKYLAYVYFDSKKYEDALEYFDRYIQYEDNITDDDVFYSRGYCENELGRYNDAIATLKKAIKLNERSVSACNELGYSNYMLQNADEALMYYNKALAVNAKSTTALNGIAEVYRTLKKDIPEAIIRYKRVIDADAKNLKALYWLGWCHNEQGRYNEAVPYLKKAIEIDDQYVSAITELGYSDYALMNYDDALADFKRSMAIKKNELNVYYTGLCYVGKKQKSEAQKMVKELQEMNSKYAKTLQDKIDKL